MVPSDGGVGFQAAFIVCVSCHLGLDGRMDWKEAIKMLVRISLKTGKKRNNGSEKAARPPDFVWQT